MSSTRALEQAQIAVHEARRRLASSASALQHRLKPGTLMSNAWEGVRDKSGEMADDALKAVKRRPLTVSGVAAAVAIFLARDPLWHLLSDFFSRGEEAEADVIRADLDHHDSDFDLTAPTAPRSANEGVDA